MDLQNYEEGILIMFFVSLYQLVLEDIYHHLSLIAQ